MVSFFCIIIEIMIISKETIQISPRLLIYSLIEIQNITLCFFNNNKVLYSGFRKLEAEATLIIRRKSE